MKQYFAILGLIITGTLFAFCGCLTIFGGLEDIRYTWFAVPIVLLIPALPILTKCLSEPPKTKEDKDL